MDSTWTNILWYLVINSLFFMMMCKGGCCGGHDHKQQKQKIKSNKTGHK